MTVDLSAECFPSPPHSATHSLRMSFWEGRCQDLGSYRSSLDTEAQFAGLTTLSIASGLVGRRCMAERGPRAGLCWLLAGCQLCSGLLSSAHSVSITW